LILGGRVGPREGPRNNVQGICLIVDFSDDVGTIAASTVGDYCNQVGYTGFGNNGSVRDYFFDVSDGALTYTNFVPTAYYRAANPKTYYTDPNIPYGTRARELIIEALTDLDNHGFDFSQYDANGDGVIDAVNCFYAGNVWNNWAEGLWPHSWTVSFCADGVCTERYQITNMGTALRLLTFCHENGHMLLGWPDLYDYDYDSTGVGQFCLMAYSTTDTNPCEPCAYLKHIAGWSQTILLTIPQTRLPVPAASANRCYKFDRPAHPNEYYLVENRQQTARDTGLPDGGLAIWHIDTLGDNSNNEMTPESHYLVTLVQADGRWDLEHNINYGDATDLWSAPDYTDCTPLTNPDTDWWDGSVSALAITNISASANVMTFDFSASVGVIVAWGSNSYAQLNVPAPNSGFVAVAAGGFNSLGLKADGSIVAWEAGACGPPPGYPHYGQSCVPTPNSGFVAVAGGYQHSLGLKADGSIVAWGRNYEGQCNVPAPNSGFVAVATRGFHSLGLKADGSIVAWEINDYGQCNVSAPNADFIGIAGGYGHSLGLKADGSIVAWGSNSIGQCNVPAPNADFIGIAGGGAHSLGLKADGSIVAWGGWNANGECNVPAPNSGFVAVAGGESHSLGLKADGSIVAWGFNGYGQCYVPAPNSGFVAVAGGIYHSLGLNALLPAMITSQPESYTCCAGQAAFFTVVAVGAPPLSYQWRKGGQPIIGATAATLTINPVGPNDAGDYDVVVTNPYGAATSDAATLTVNTAVVITTQPQSQTRCEGQSVTFSVATSGTPPLGYQWYKDGPPIWGAVSSSYSIDSLDLADAGAYRVVVSNSCGSVASDLAILTVLSAPSITQQPAGGTVPVPEPAVLSTLATGGGTLTYQWRKNGTDLHDGGRISGATSPTLTMSPTWMSDSGSYDVVVTNDCGSVTSDQATLTVTGLGGDLNCDGTIDFDDVNPFVLAVTDQAAYEAAYPDCNWLNGDCNDDGYVDFDDINPFVVILSGGG
jgi:M6 family metalloprotease-like protein